MESYRSRFEESIGLRVLTAMGINLKFDGACRDKFESLDGVGNLEIKGLDAL